MQQSEIVTAIVRNHDALHRFLPDWSDADLGAISHDMVVGDDLTVRAHSESRAGAIELALSWGCCRAIPLPGCRAIVAGLRWSRAGRNALSARRGLAQRRDQLIRNLAVHRQADVSLEGPNCDTGLRADHSINWPRSIAEISQESLRFTYSAL
jgi:hypothetical protein